MTSRVCISLVGMALMATPLCGAQEDAYPPVSVAEPEPYSSSVMMDASLPPPQKATPAKGHWWDRLIPSPTAQWLISSLADNAYSSYMEVDALTTQHIRSGKGVREGKLTVKGLVGLGSTASLVRELRRKKKR